MDYYSFQIILNRKGRLLPRPNLSIYNFIKRYMSNQFNFLQKNFIHIITNISHKRNQISIAPKNHLITSLLKKIEYTIRSKSLN